MENTYLAHHGIKGMKWGVRRTPEQLGRKDAKRIAKRLNQLDQERAEAIGAHDKYTRMNRGYAERYSNAYNKLQRTESDRAANKVKKMAAKVNKYADKAENEEKRIASIKQEARALGREAVEKNYNIQVRRIDRSTLSKGERVLQAYLMYDANIFYDRTTRGDQFKAVKNRKKGKRYLNESWVD